jgi:hypothetical protein
MGLKSTLQWYWDLSSADASIVDQHSGLSLSKLGTTTTLLTGGPDGGPCIDFGSASGKYRNASVAKTISYDDGFTVNIWAYSTGSSPTFNCLINHRGPSTPNLYFQVLARVFSGIDSASTIDAAGTFRECQPSQFGLNAWQMLTLVDTGTASTLYRNGVSVATSSTALGARSTAAAPFAIGGHAWSAPILSGLEHRGRLAMAGVWNEPLVAGDVTKLYNGGSGLRYANLGGNIIPILRQHYAAQGAR